MKFMIAIGRTSLCAFGAVLLARAAVPGDSHEWAAFTLPAFFACFPIVRLIEGLTDFCEGMAHFLSKKL